MLQASFNSEFQERVRHIGTHIRSKGDASVILNDPDLRNAVRRVLNHYEFISAGLRNGDFDEQLVVDSERSAILQLYAGCKDYIWSLRDDRKRMSTYEHLEWLNARWSDPHPHPLRSFFEWVRQRPLQGQRHNPHRSVAR